jgi:hypothetical protein
MLPLPPAPFTPEVGMTMEERRHAAGLLQPVFQDP